MPYSTARTWLRQAAARLTAIVSNPLAWRATVRNLDAFPDPVAAWGGTRLIVRRASCKWETHDGAAIDPGETMIRLHPEGVEVRGWLLLRHGEISPLAPAVVSADTNFLDGLPAQTIEIFLLNQKEGRNYHEIAETLGLSERQVRGHMRRAIAHIAARR